jgi:hypothetical protein
MPLANLLLLLLAATCTGARAQELSALFAREVPHQLAFPAEEQLRYAALLAEHGIALNEMVLLIDRHEHIQAALLFGKRADGSFEFAGAAPVSTGKPGRFEHFLTPLGAFLHTPDHPDYRAKGTKNKKGVRGYGAKGMRVYDFGWQKGKQTWGRKAESKLRLQMHSTDPDLLEKRLGSRQSKGCIRISAALNTFLDRYGILEAEYDALRQTRDKWWMSFPERQPLPAPFQPGRYLVVVETERTERPAWSPDPLAKLVK